MKERIRIVISSIIIIGAIGIVVYAFQENSFLHKYDNVLQSYFGEYECKEDKGTREDKSDRYSGKIWSVRYGSTFNERADIRGDESLFLQLEQKYIFNNEQKLTQKLNNNNLSIYFKNASHVNNSLITDFKKVDDKIADNYSKYYPKSFNIYEDYTLDKLFVNNDTPIYLIIICDSQETAKQCIKEIKNLNAVIRISSDYKNIGEKDIEDETIKETKDNYLFVYNGQLVQTDFISKNEDYNDNENIYKQGTLLYNYNQYVKSKYNK